MKKKNWIWIAVILVAAILAFLLIRSCNKNGPPPDIIATTDSVQYWKNQAGQLVTSMKQREQDYNKISAAWRDSIEKLNNTKFKLVNLVAQLSLKGNTSVPATAAPEIIYRKDTVTGECPPQIATVIQNYQSKWYSAVDSIDLLDSSNSKLTLQTKDSIWLVGKTVNEGGLFNKRTYLQFDARNANPDNVINGLNIYKKPLPKQTRWGIGPQAGVTYSAGLKLYLGIGVHYDFIRF